MLAQFRQAANSRMMRRLATAPVTMTGGTPRAYLAVRDKTMHHLGVGTARDMKSVVTGVVWPSLKTRQYTLAEKIRLWHGKFSSGASALWDEMISTDLGERVTELALPAYLLHGIYDYTASYPLAKAYAERVNAPLKGFYTFAESTHSPIFEKPEKAQKIMREDVLGRSNHLAD